MEAILESQEKLQALFMQRMDDFQGKLQVSPSTSKASTSLADEFTSFRSFILQALKSLQNQISLMASEVDKQEMRARRKILLFHGVPEAKSEDTVATVIKVISERLRIPNFTSADVNRCHRMGRSSGPDKCRPILLKCREMPMRQRIWYAKTALKNSGITLSEFLTKPRHESFMLARERFGVGKCWTRDGFVIVLGSDGKRHSICNRTELENLEAPTSIQLKKPEVETVKKGAKAGRRAPLK